MQENPKATHPFDPKGTHPLNPGNWQGAMGECPTCKGTGKVIDSDSFGPHYAKCPTCNGSKQIRDLTDYEYPLR